MEKSGLLRALEISETVTGNWSGIDLKEEIQKIGQYLIGESRGKNPEYGWLDRSLSVLKPRCLEETRVYCKEMIPFYETVLKMYQEIRGHRKETPNMIEFRNKVGFWYRYLKMMYSAKTVDETK